jgi:ATP/maltotriose-dependent transcriptional regulator MalT
MDASDFKGPSGVSMALMGSESGGVARVARGSDGHWDSEISGESNDYYPAIVLAVRLVEALQILGETEEASLILARALRISMNSGIFQTFLDGGNHVHAMLIHLYNRPAPDGHDLLPFLSTLVRRLPARPISRESPRTTAVARRVLSARECHILQLMGRGMSNKRIAQELKIAPETVKSHAKHIFVKLNAQTRAEAVARAIGLRLL